LEREYRKWIDLWVFGACRSFFYAILRAIMKCGICLFFLMRNEVLILDIREIEKIIDHVHDNHPAFCQNRNQLMYELLTTFEDLCSLNIMASMLNPMAVHGIVDQMDALNMALYWATRKTNQNNSECIDINISEERYKQCSSLLREYAFPYSMICSSYISFSRGRLTADIDNNMVMFNMAPNQNNSVWGDILREADSGSAQFAETMNPLKLLQAVAVLKQNVSVENDMICYSLSGEIIEPFKEIATKQWEATKTLPETWKFDTFSLADYKEFWINITTLCYIHFYSCLEIKNPLVRIRNSTIVQSRKCILDYVVNCGGIEREKAEAIIKYITYNPKKKNTDIMYQPIVEVGNEQVVIAPMLFMGSRPERNLLVLVGLNNDDYEHSKEVNDLENLMISDLETVVVEDENIKIAKHRDIDAALPDIDFAILDISTNSAMICELKWFAAADSAKEVYAKEDEITHGCQQIETLMTYALRNKALFFKQLFGIDGGEDIDLFCCVVAKHNIRTQHKYVPVIDLKRILELFKSKSLNSVFHTIRNHEYEIKLPEDAEITHNEISYGGFVFKTPAICFGSPTDVWM